MIRASDGGSQRRRTSSTIARVPSPWQSLARPGASPGCRGTARQGEPHDTGCHGSGFHIGMPRREHDAQEWSASIAMTADRFSAEGSPGPHKTRLRRGFDKMAPCVTILSVSQLERRNLWIPDAAHCCALLSPCRSGGIGRRAWFRSMYSQGCGGSSPFFGTISSKRLAGNHLRGAFLRSAAVARL